MKKVLIFILTISLLLLAGCTDENECPNCLETTSKSIKYIDSSGNNLFFGGQAIYDPNNIVITADNNEIVDFDMQADKGIIVFVLEGNNTSYQIKLSDKINYIVEFELAERKSENCCGNVTYSTKTIINEQEIENNDSIVITN